MNETQVRLGSKHIGLLVIQIETVASMERREKAEFVLEQVRGCSVRVGYHSTNHRCDSTLQMETLGELKLFQRSSQQRCSWV